MRISVLKLNSAMVIAIMAFNSACGPRGFSAHPDLHNGQAQPTIPTISPDILGKYSEEDKVVSRGEGEMKIVVGEMFLDEKTSVISFNADTSAQNSVKVEGEATVNGKKFPVKLFGEVDSKLGYAKLFSLDTSKDPVVRGHAVCLEVKDSGEFDCSKFYVNVYAKFAGQDFAYLYQSEGPKDTASAQAPQTGAQEPAPGAEGAQAGESEAENDSEGDAPQGPLPEDAATAEAHHGDEHAENEAPAAPGLWELPQGIGDLMKEETPEEWLKNPPKVQPAPAKPSAAPQPPAAAPAKPGGANTQVPSAQPPARPVAQGSKPQAAAPARPAAGAAQPAAPAVKPAAPVAKPSLFQKIKGFFTGNTGASNVQTPPAVTPPSRAGSRPSAPARPATPPAQAGRSAGRGRATQPPAAPVAQTTTGRTAAPAAPAASQPTQPKVAAPKPTKPKPAAAPVTQRPQPKPVKPAQTQTRPAAPAPPPPPSANASVRAPPASPPSVAAPVVRPPAIVPPRAGAGVTTERAVEAEEIVVTGRRQQNAADQAVPDLTAPFVRAPSEQAFYCQFFSPIKSYRCTDIPKLVSATALDKSSPYYKVQGTDGRYFGTKLMIDFLTRIGKRLNKAIKDYRIGILDVTDRDGGPQLASGRNYTKGRMGRLDHASHMNGLDADIRYVLKDPDAVGYGPAGIVGRRGMTREKIYVDHQWDLWKAAVKTGYVSQIFVNQKVKNAFCAVAREKKETVTAKETLHRLRAYEGHTSHWHLRLRCPDGALRCRNEPAPAREGRDGTGC